MSISSSKFIYQLYKKWTKFVDGTGPRRITVVMAIMGMEQVITKSRNENVVKVVGNNLIQDNDTVVERKLLMI